MEPQQQVRVIEYISNLNKDQTIFKDDRMSLLALQKLRLPAQGIMCELLSAPEVLKTNKNHSYSLSQKESKILPQQSLKFMM